jgi:hypothetical protein
VYFSIGSEEKDHRTEDYIGVLRNACLELGKMPNIDSKTEVIEGETHASVVTPSIWRGLKFFTPHP